jgi:diguanylate cyclase (GGDEF)-like protein
MKEKNNATINGFNSARYKRMAIIFVVLSLLNMSAVLLAFRRSGYGLYHAEDALSHVARINHYVQDINESAMSIVINNNDSDRIAKEVSQITQTFSEINEEIEAYSNIDLDEIDPELKVQFNEAKEKIDNYHNALMNYKNEIQDYTVSNKAELSEYVAATMNVYTSDIEPLKDSAADSVTELFNMQSQATYDFFVRCAQQFLFVLLFLIITMVIGLIGINNMKKKARRDAETIEVEQKRAKESREKSVNIAYSNILTGFKNRYGLEADISDKLASKKFTIALFNFNNFSYINEKYGRDTGDEFLSVVSVKLQQKYAKVADIYSTDADEFCFIFKKNVSPDKADELIYQIAETMSKPVAVTDHAIQNMVSACFCHYNPGDQPDLNSLLRNFDRAMKVAQEKSRSEGHSSVVNIDTM